MDIKEILSIITLKKLDENKFEGKNYQTIWGRVFGGQVYEKSLDAPYQPVLDDKVVDPMHVFFILLGVINILIIYMVEKIRYVESFTTRRFVAVKHNKQIFHCAYDFQKI